MMSIKYTQQARDDLAKIAIDITERCSSLAAIDLISKITKYISLLEMSPELGVAKAGGTREIYPEKYRVVYKITGNDVIILTIIHCRMLYPR